MIFIPSPNELKRLRLRAGLTQAELAKRAGVSQSLIARIESGNVNPRLSTLKKILTVLEECLEEELKVSDVMTSPVIYVNIEDGIENIIETMWSNAISQVPVLNKNGEIVGTVYEKDVVTAFLRYKEEALNKKAKDIMSDPLPIVPPSTKLSTIAKIICDDTPAVLVADGKRLLGIVTRSDIMKNYLSFFRGSSHT